MRNFMEIEENRMRVRAYEVAIGDVISISLDAFIKNSYLWENCWLIQDFYKQRVTRKFLWWKRFPSFKKVIMVKLMYLGEDYKLKS